MLATFPLLLFFKRNPSNRFTWPPKWTYIYSFVPLFKLNASGMSVKFNLGLLGEMSAGLKCFCFLRFT